MSVLIRIQTLEKMLEDCLSQLEQEGKRRRILENWVLQNFSFNIQLELESEEGNKSGNNSRSSLRRPKTTELEFEVAENTQIYDQDPLYSPSSSDNFEDHVEPEVKRKKPKNKRNPDDSTTTKSSGGRSKEPVWDHYRIVEPLRNKCLQAFCKKCNKKVSSKAYRLKMHLNKCTGTNQNDFRHNHNHSATQINLPATTTTDWETEDAESEDKDRNPQNSITMQYGQYKYKNK